MGNMHMGGPGFQMPSNPADMAPNQPVQPAQPVQPTQPEGGDPKAFAVRSQTTEEFMSFLRDKRNEPQADGEVRRTPATSRGRGRGRLVNASLGRGRGAGAGFTDDSMPINGDGGEDAPGDTSEPAASSAAAPS